MTNLTEKINPSLAYEKLSDLEASINGVTPYSMSDNAEAFHNFTLGCSLSTWASLRYWLGFHQYLSKRSRNVLNSPNYHH